MRNATASSLIFRVSAEFPVSIGKTIFKILQRVGTAKATRGKPMDACR
jgi:hypothetical protein